MKTGLNHAELQSQIKGMIQKLEAVGKNIDAEAEKIVTTMAHKLEEEAVKRMPVDEGFLEKSIDRKVVKNGTGAHSVEGVVYIPTNSPASDYALYMHEMTYNLGKRSQAKQAGSKVTVGRKYMERALTENARAFALYILKKLKGVIGDK